jgi:glycosyltransferase involved in cell wall biosynthesis
LGFDRRDTTVIYPMVAPEFVWRDGDAQCEVRSALALRHRHVLVNARQLQPWAGHRDLIEALGEVIRTHPDTRLIIFGVGPLLGELKTISRAFGVEGHITFAGAAQIRALAQYLVAADAFVLPSTTETCPAAAIEALASGTPVIASDTPGGVELNDLFGTDVIITPREKPVRLARAIVDLLENKRRTRNTTRETIDRDFRPAVIGEQFRAVYERAIANASVG